MELTAEQYEVLLKPLASSRVAHRSQGGMQLSYLEAWDVRAHLIRIFGFGGWSADVLSADLMYEEKNEKGRWEVGYKVVMRLRIHAQDDFLGDTTYTEAAVGSATLPQRGEAHDMAVKTAESDALKRAAVNLGTQFGLSLYDNGSRQDVVKHTLRPAIGYDGSELDVVEAPTDIVGRVREAQDIDELRILWESASAGGWLDSNVLIDGAATALRGVIADRVAEMQEQVT